MAQSFREMEFKVGLFVIITGVIMLGLILYLGYKKELFSEKVYFYVVSQSGENIERGIPIRLSGFNIGQVNIVELEDPGNIRIEIKILKKHMRWFREDSRILVDREGLIGNAYLKVLPGSKDSPLLPPGSVLRLESSARSISDLVAEAQPAMEDLKIIVSNIRFLTDQFVDKDDTAQQLLGNLERVSATLASEEGMFHYLLDDKRPVGRMDSILSDAESIMGNMELFSAKVVDLEDEISMTIREAKTFLSELTNLRRELQPTFENLHEVSKELRLASRDLERFRRQGEEALDLSADVLKRLGQTWPLTRTIIQEAPAPELPAP
jgi:phospholipid/cholesterol/gamma-HCH transport system substrate-binding protein